MESNHILYQSMEEVMHNSMMPYAEYIILERSLPRVEDGLKPVQRRILFAMSELGITPDKPHKKSARIVGETLGKYHPHGDTSVYDAMVRMAQEYNMGETLIDGHGNFGSIDGDSAAAMRYTEARLTPIALELLRDLDKDTVPFQFNFDDSLKEPELLPAAFPNLLVNGATGIAIGLATNIPQHNLTEVINGVIAQMENEHISLETLMDIVKGPDFPTGGTLFANNELFRAYETGRGRLILRGKIQREHLKNGKTNIVIEELPYQVNKALLLERILKISEEKKELFADIADIRDESDRDGMRAVVEVKKGGNVDRILKGLYQYSDLQVSYSVNMVAIAGGKPVQMGLLEMNRHYIQFRKQVVIRRTKYDLDNAKKREHILKGLMIAVEDIDRVIALIKASKSPKEAKERLMEAYALSEIQAQAILDMRLQRLTALQIEALKKEYAELLNQIAYLEGILNSETKLKKLIIQELEKIRDQYGHARRTKIVWDENPEQKIQLEKVIPSSDMRIAVQPNGFLLCAKEAKGALCLDTKTDRSVALFTDYGNCYRIDGQKLPVHKSGDWGVPLTSLFAGVESDERVLALYDQLPEEKLLQFVTARGMIKRTKMSEYATRKAKIAAVGLKGDDRVVSVEEVDDRLSNLLITQKGMSIRFSGEGIHPIGRTSAGVKAIKLAEDDRVIFARQVGISGQVLVLSDRGYGKKSLLLEYELQNRSGKGLKTFEFKPNHANGDELVFADVVEDGQHPEYAIGQKDGTVTAVHFAEFALEGRYSKGINLVIVLMDNVVTGCGRQA